MNRHPLELELIPIGLRKPWGGTKLQEQLRPDLELEPPVGECWEISDVGEVEDGLHSVIAAGPSAGTTLHDLIEKFPEKILGTAHRCADAPRLPLLFKYIDAAKDLSVQVHPDDHLAQQLGLGCSGKTEAWIILAADEGARLQIGLRDGWDVSRLVERVRSGGDSSMALHQVEVEPGDIFHLPAGTVHSIGGGILLAEIQQSSDITWRIDDGGRPGLDGKPRTLHLDQVLLTTTPPGSPQLPLRREIPDEGGWWRPISSEPFVLDELRGSYCGGLPAPPSGFSILAVLAGEARLNGSDTVLGSGDVRFILPTGAPSGNSDDSLEIATDQNSWILCASTP